MSGLEDASQDCPNRRNSGNDFIAGTQFTRTKTVSLLDQIKENEREEKIENLFDFSGDFLLKKKKKRREDDEDDDDDKDDDVDKLLSIFGEIKGDDEERDDEEDDEEDERARKRQEKVDEQFRRTFETFDTEGKNSSGRLILKVKNDEKDGGWTESIKQKLPKDARDSTKWDQRQLEVPVKLAERLQEYQRDGVRFFHGLYARNLGGLLADEMGLGKTVQCVAFATACLLANKPRGGFAGGGEARRMVKGGVLMRSKKKSMWQDDSDDGEEDLKKDKNDNEDEEEPVRVQDDVEETRFDKWGKRELLSEEEAKKRGVNANNRRPILIIVPTTLIDNWKNEFEKWGEAIGENDKWDVTVAVAHGNNREMVYDDIENHRGVDVVITTANILSRDIQSNPDFNIWTNTNWDFCIIDEMHISMKNPKTQSYKAMCQMKCLKFGLTGTPYQNNPQEMYAIFDLLNANCIGSRGHFKSYYENPMKKARGRGASEFEIGVGRQRAKQLQALLKIYMLKRMKSDVLKAGTMKKKTEKVVFCDLAPAQRRAYERIRESTSVQLILNKDSPCDCGSGEERNKCCYPANGLDDDDGDEMWCAYGPHGRHKSCPMCVGFACIFACRNVSNHLELLKPFDLHPNPKEEDILKHKRAQAVAKVALGDELDALGGLRPQQNFLAASNFDHCGKMKTLSILLERFHKKNDKVVLFSYSVRLLNVMNEFVKRMGYVHVRLDGGTAVKERQKIVDDFNKRGSCFLFLMSSEAGGVGLNIASANKVIIFDPAWNPAKDLQSQDRVYRLGNKRDVEVYRLISAGTLEELVYSRQIYKQQMGSTMTAGKMERRLFDGIQGDHKNKGELWGIVNLLRLNMAGKVELREKVEEEKRKDEDEEEDIIKEEGYEDKDGFKFRVAKGLDREQVRDIGNALEEQREAAAKRGENIFEALLDDGEDDDNNEKKLHALHTMDHNKLFGVSDKEKKRIENAERASKNEKLLKRLAKKRKEAEASMNKGARNRKKNALDPRNHAVQDMALRAMAKYNNMSELDFAKLFLSLKTKEEAEYALMRNVEGLKSEMDDFDDDDEEED